MRTRMICILVLLCALAATTLYCPHHPNGRPFPSALPELPANKTSLPLPPASSSLIPKTISKERVSEPSAVAASPDVAVLRLLNCLQRGQDAQLIIECTRGAVAKYGTPTAQEVATLMCSE